MDSITQFALGAAVGETALGKRIGRKAALWGGLLGTLPDLDVVIPMGNAVADFTYHRSFSHSLFVLAALTPLIAWYATRYYRSTGISFKYWCTATYAVFATHVLLDSLTAYGTQIFWPFVTTPVSWSTIFIIDPLYTVPILLGLAGAQIFDRNRKRSFRANQLGLLLSSLYLAFTIGTKLHVEQRIAHAVEAQQIEATSWFTTPAPLTTLLWRTVIMTETGYYEGFYSLFDGETPLKLYHYPSDTSLLEPLNSNWSVNRLIWFTHGFYAVNQQDSSVIVSDLRMGVEPNYIFRFGFDLDDELKPDQIKPNQLQPDRSLAGLPLIWDRIWNPAIEFN